jgi:N-carbamoylputrescine amidase
MAKAGQDADEVLTAQIDMARTEVVRRNWPFLRDRRTDAYADLLLQYRD